MEKVTLEHDISVFYVKAHSFPDVILEVHTRLHSLIPDSNTRQTYGISHPENGAIVYKAGFEEKFTGEVAAHNCETMVLNKGEYYSIMLRDFMNSPNSVKNALTTLLALPGFNRQVYCVERYLNEKDVECMIRVAD